MSSGKRAGSNILFVCPARLAEMNMHIEKPGDNDLTGQVELNNLTYVLPYDSHPVNNTVDDENIEPSVHVLNRRYYLAITKK
jgi:hypothetical protein